MAITRAGSVTTAEVNLSELGLTTSAQLASVITDEVGSGELVFNTAPTLVRPELKSPFEVATVSSTAATGVINFDISTQNLLYYTSNATGNFIINFRGSGSATLSSLMASVGSSVTAVFLSTNGTTAYYPTGFQIDGVSVTPKWQSGASPAAGTPSAVDVYSFTIIKTALTPSYAVLASAVKFS